MFIKFKYNLVKRLRLTVQQKHYALRNRERDRERERMRVRVRE